MSITQIPPHGGKLINGIAKGKERDELLKKAELCPKLKLSLQQISDIEMLSIGAFSPLDGFLLEEDYNSVVENCRLKSGVVWSIPVTLAVSKEEAGSFKQGETLALTDKDNTLGLLHLEQIYPYNKAKEAREVYRTEEEAHPGVAYLYDQGEYLLGGKVTLLNKPVHTEFSEYWFDPAETRKVFAERAWERVVGFQTRNPIHRAHEFIIKCAMEITDGFFLNPLVGQTKKGDIPANIRMQCYTTLVEKYFPKERVFMAVYGASMRYAGPREALLHAFVRKNFGCTHFIVGRDHAGVGSYYGTFDAQKIFDAFTPEEIGITPLFFDHSFYCRHCGEMASIKTCPHPKEEHLSLSGTKVRELLKAGELPPPTFSRPEVADILIEAYKQGTL